MKYSISSAFHKTLGQKHSSPVLYHLIMRTVFPLVSSSRVLLSICDLNKIPTRGLLIDAFVNSQVSEAWSTAILFPSPLQLPATSQLQESGFFIRTRTNTPNLRPSPHLKVTPTFFICFSSVAHPISALLHLGN